MSSFMISHLANVVASGTRTSSGFKKIHLNECARAMNEKFNTKRTGEQMKNHLKTWQRKYAKLNRLRNLSAAGWDEDNCIITLDAKHYNNYVADHKANTEYLNKHLEHYAEMATIFGNSMAIGKFAKDSNSALGTEDGEPNVYDDANGVDDGIPSPDDNAASSSVSRSKRAKIADNEEEGLVGAFKFVGQQLAKAIEKAAAPTNDVPENLWDNLNSLSDFEALHISYYYAHLVANPNMAKAFIKLPFEHKLNWIVMFINEKFSG